MVFDDRVEFFYNNQVLHLAGKVPDQLHRQRIGHAQFQDADFVTEDLFHILIGC